MLDLGEVLSQAFISLHDYYNIGLIKSETHVRTNSNQRLFQMK